MPTASYFSWYTPRKVGKRKVSLREALMYFSVFTGLNHPHLPAQFPHPTSCSTRHPSDPSPPTNCTTAHTTSESYLSFLKEGFIPYFSSFCFFRDLRRRVKVRCLRFHIAIGECGRPFHGCGRGVLDRRIDYFVHKDRC
jgi:hypothetical protein